MAVDWSQFKPVSPTNAADSKPSAVDWSQFKPVEAPAAGPVASQLRTSANVDRSWGEAITDTASGIGQAGFNSIAGVVRGVNDRAPGAAEAERESGFVAGLLMDVGGKVYEAGLGAQRAVGNLIGDAEMQAEATRGLEVMSARRAQTAPEDLKRSGFAEAFAEKANEYADAVPAAQSEKAQLIASEMAQLSQTEGLSDQTLATIDYFASPFLRGDLSTGGARVSKIMESLIPSLAAGGIAAKAVGAAGAGAGIQTAAQLGTMSVMEGGGAAEGARGEVLNTPIEALQAAPEFQAALRMTGGDPLRARDLLADQAASISFGLGTAAAGATMGLGQAFGANVAEQAVREGVASLATGAGVRQALLGTAGAAGKEFASEFAQGASNQAAQNVGTFAAGANDSLGRGVVAAGIMEGIAGGASGVAAQAAAEVSKRLRPIEDGEDLLGGSNVATGAPGAAEPGGLNLPDDPAAQPISSAEIEALRQQQLAALLAKRDGRPDQTVVDPVTGKPVTVRGEPKQVLNDAEKQILGFLQKYADRPDVLARALGKRLDDSAQPAAASNESPAAPNIQPPAAAQPAAEPVAPEPVAPSQPAAIPVTTPAAPTPQPAAAQPAGIVTSALRPQPADDLLVDQAAAELQGMDDETPPIAGPVAIDPQPEEVRNEEVQQVPDAQPAAGEVAQQGLRPQGQQEEVAPAPASAPQTGIVAGALAAQLEPADPDVVEGQLPAESTFAAAREREIPSEAPPPESFIPQVLSEIGWLQKGGFMIRDPETAIGASSQAEIDPERGDVVDRTKWIGKPAADGTESQFWRMRPNRSLSEAEATAAVEKWRQGRKLGPRQQEFIDYMLKAARDYAEQWNTERTETMRAIVDLEAEGIVEERDELRAAAIPDATPEQEREALALEDMLRRAIDLGATREELVALIEQNPNRRDHAREIWHLIKQRSPANATDQQASDGGPRSGVEPEGRGQAEPDPAGEAAPRAAEAEQAAAPAAESRAEGLTLSAPAAPPASQQVRAPSQQGGLFAPPTRGEQLKGEAKRREDERNGKNATGRTDMMAGDGELFAGPRPEQVDVEQAIAAEQSQPGKRVPLENATAPEHVRTGLGEQQLGVTVDELKQIAAEFREAINSGVDAGVTRIFESPRESEVVRLQDKVKVHVSGKGWMTLDAARAEIRRWEDNAVQQGKDSIEGKNNNGQKVVLSLFDLSGEWSLPWEQAGYQVFRFDIQDGNTYTDPETGEERKLGDVHNMSVEFFNDLFGSFDGMDVHAILAACPCTDFAVSGARHFAAKDADGRTVSSVELVKKTLAAIEYFKPAVWAIENPVGRIEQLTGLPPWRLSFDPNHLGDPYTKKTLIWGRFNADLPIAPVEPTEGSMMHKKFGGKSLKTKNARSVTPEGFAYAFFQANNAVDNPMVALAGKYDRLDPAALQGALDAGLSESGIADLIDDAYYIDLDDDAAELALRKAAAENATEDPRDRTVSEAEARQEIQWVDMGTSGGFKTIRLRFRGMAYGDLSKYGKDRWIFDGERFDGLAEAKRAAADSAIERLRRDGYVTAAPAATDAAAELAAISLDDLSALIDDIAAEVGAAETQKPLKQRKLRAPKAPGSAPKKPSTAKSPAEQARTEGRKLEQLAKNLGINASGAGMEALKGLSELFGGPGRLNSGLSFDEQTYAKAKPHFEKALAHTVAAGKDLRDLVRELVITFGQGIKPYLIRFAQEARDVPSTTGDVERAGEAGRAPASDMAEADGAADGEDAAGSGSAGGRMGAGLPGADGARGPAGGAAAGGASGDQRLSADQPDGRDSAAGDAGAADGRGSDGDGGSGVQADRDGARGATEAAAGARGDREKLSEQRAAESIPVEPGSIENIRATLPYLLEGQQDDVAKAEARFAKPDGYGMLFTNGTGTGKTFTGLGVVKRFQRQGKTNVLIVAPSDKIMSDWIKSGVPLGLDITALANTGDAGRGIVVTTYANLGQNDALAKREWDLIVADEAHYFMRSEDGAKTAALEALRAIALHPDGYMRRADMLNRDLVDRGYQLSEAAALARKSDDQREWARAEGLQSQANAVFAELKAKRDQMQADVLAKQGAARPRAVFLSATPFAYEKTVDWAQGFLFTYPESKGGGYNSPDSFGAFMVSNFGYRMRYGKLTAPEAGVDSGLMQRMFNTRLKREGVLSGRRLDVAADYSRNFVLVESAIGRRIDQAMEWMRENDGTRELSDKLRESFDYLARRYTLEALKARESVELIREHIALGRKVVVFHDYKKGGARNPFDFDPDTVGPTEAQTIERFRDEFGDLIEAMRGLVSPIDLLQREFPGLLLFNGSIPPKQRRANVDTFNDDSNGPQVILVQTDAGKEGISLHDTTGKHQRALINLGMPTKPTDLIQQEGRIYRTGQVGNAIFSYLNTGTSWERATFAQTIAGRASAAENLGMGEEARALKDSLVQAFEDSAMLRPGYEGEGTGGKAADAAAARMLTEHDRAVALYYANQKKTSRTKSAEGVDYFATPEPVGLAMVRMADIRPGESALEPSAGHGAIARWFGDTVKKTAVEPSAELASRLALSFDGRIVDGRFESLDLVNKFDAIVMNPPFGTAGRTAVDHVAKAARHLREGGRLVALIPTGPAADKKFDAWLYEQDDKSRSVHADLHLVATVELPAVTFERAGTSVRTRIVVIDKMTGDVNMQTQGRDLSSAETIKELFDRVERMEIRPRAKVAGEAASFDAAPATKTEIKKQNEWKDEARESAKEAGVAPTGEPIVIHITQKGKELVGVVRTGINKAQAQAIDAYTFAKNGGWFIRVEHLKPAGNFSQPQPGDRIPMGALRSETAMRLAVAAALDSWNGSKPIVRVVRTAAELPADAKMGQGWQTAEGYFDGDGGVWLVTENLSDPQRALEVLRHEAVGHFGVERIAGAAWPSIVAGVEAMRGQKRTGMSKPMAAALAEAEARYETAASDDPLLFAKELLAVMAETGTRAGFMDRMLSQLRAFLRKTGLIGEAFSEAELRNVLSGAFRLVERGGSLIAGAPVATGGMQSIRPDDVAAYILRMMGQSDADLFRYPKSDSTSFARVMQEVSSGEIKAVKLGEVEANFTENLDDLLPAVKWGLRLPDGAQAFVYVEQPSPYQLSGGLRLFIDASAGNSGASLGSAAYAALFQWALNTGHTFIGDPNGLSTEALLRRTEHMLSAALKHGTTRMMAPHDRQIDPMNKKWGPSQEWAHPLQWTDGDDVGNITALIRTSVENHRALLKGTEADGAVYRLSDGQFIGAGGQPLTDEGLRRAAATAGARFRASGRFAGPESRAAAVGGTTVARTLVLQSILEGSTGSAAQRRELLAQLAERLSSQRLTYDRARRVFYSRPGPDQLQPQDQTETPEFRRWFGDSKVVDAEGKPLVVYHGTVADFDAFQKDKGKSKNQTSSLGFWFTDSPVTAESFANRQSNEYITQTDPETGDVYRWPDGEPMKFRAPNEVGSVMPAYLSIRNPVVFNRADGKDSFERFMDFRDRWARYIDGTQGIEGYWSRRVESVDSAGTNESMANWLRENGHDGIVIEGTEYDGDGKRIDQYVALDPTQIKSATGNRGTFDPADPRITFSRPRAAVLAARQRVQKLTSRETIDRLIYEFQDKFVDLKRIQAHIRESGGTVSDLNDAYLGEELYHSRVMARHERFMESELKPLLADLNAAGFTVEQFEQFLHARHAPEANAVLMKRNPDAKTVQDERDRTQQAVRALEIQLQKARNAGAATAAIEQALEIAEQQRDYWKRVQPFRGTDSERAMLSGMSDADAAAVMAALSPADRAKMDALAARIDAINAKTLDQLERYGLMSRADLDAWRKTYQFYVPLHRDEANPDSTSHPTGAGFSVRGDAAKSRTGSAKAKVTNILAHIAMQREAAITRGEKNAVAKKLYVLAGQNPDPNLWTLDKAPSMKRVDPVTGTVRSMPDPTYRQQPNVVMVRIGGEDRAIVFNERNTRALRLAESLKNLDVDDLHVVLGWFSKATRWLASVNTQYNPVFGIVNLIRDTQGVALQLSTTPLKGKEAQVLRRIPAMLRSIYRERRGKGAASPEDARLQRLWDDMRMSGGVTGYRDLFRDPMERANAIEAELQKESRGTASRWAHAVVDWLSDYNEAIENATRLAAYEQALVQGMTKERAASIAKNITVNFNRKGRQARELGALYAFFNAAVQGTARMLETLSGPRGRAIMAGGVALGFVNSLIGLAVMGGDEWEKIPAHVKERAVVIPISGKDYISIPMPLGYHVFPNIGRIAAEMMTGTNDTAAASAGELLRIGVDSFNPLGGTSTPLQMIMPTALDPVAALAENRDWTGRPIYREDFSSTDPTPGFTRSKDTASMPAKVIAWGANAITGGDDYEPGAFSPTPDQIDYVIGQLTGGLGREILKAQTTLTAPITGEELPAYKIPLVSRLYGNTRGQAGESERFYSNLAELNIVERRMKGMARAGEDVDAYMAAEPLTDLVGMGTRSQSVVQRLRSAQRQATAAGDSEQAEAIRAQITEVMAELNREVRAAKQ